MQFRSNNIIPLNQQPAQPDFLRDICDQLNQLTIEHIHPVADSLIPHLIEKTEEQLEQISNNHEVMMKMEVKNALLKNNSQITTLFKKISSNTSVEPSPDGEEKKPFVLLDNTELDHRLAWLIAAEKMSNKENIQQIFRIKNRFENTFPDFEEQIPASPEKLCESFSIAIDLIQPEEVFKQQLLVWFTQFISNPAYNLWNEADQLLETIGLELKRPAKTPQDYAYQDDLNKDSLPDRSSEHFDAEFIDLMADKLVTRVEDMLIRDDLIPESKKYQMRTKELTGVLAGLQLEIMQQHISISSLTESIQSAMDKKGEQSTLSPRHKDLINLVGMLFEFILDNHPLPGNIRKSISLLQIPVLRTAILDCDFLTEKNHPARVLLKKMTSVGTECHDNHFANSVSRLIDSIVHTIISQSCENPDIFRECLDRFREKLDLINQPEDITTSITEEVVTECIEERSESENTAESLLEEGVFEEAEEIILESIAPETNPSGMSSTESSPDSKGGVKESCSLPPDKEQRHKLIDGLKIGQWVVFVGEGETHRLSCKLTQIDNETNRYIFENKSGMKVAEYDSAKLLNEINSESIIIESDVPAFDRALQAVFEKLKIR